MPAKPVDEVLADLRTIGAFEGKPKAPPPLILVPPPVPDGSPPQISARPRDVCLEEMARCADVAASALEAFGDAVMRALRGVQIPEEDGEEDWEEDWEEGPESPEGPDEDAEEPEERDDSASLARAREAAIRKIRGEDLGEGSSGLPEEEEVPYVGQERALPWSPESEEVTIGTVGTKKASFPAEE